MFSKKTTTHTHPKKQNKTKKHHRNLMERELGRHMYLQLPFVILKLNQFRLITTIINRFLGAY